MSIYKEDIFEAKERLKAWWDNEPLDRPCIQYFCTRSDVKFEGIYDRFHLAREWDDFEGSLEDFERKSKSYIFGGENIPWYFPNYGAGIMAALFGVTPKYMTQTVWFSRPTPVEEIVNLLESAEMNGNNPWYDRLMRIAEYAAKRSGGNYLVTLTDLGGIMDILSSFLGPTNIILAMKRQPEIIDASRAIILEKTLKVYDDLQNIIERYQEGCNCWLNIWCPKRWYPIQSDFSYMLSPKLFKRFVLPDIVAQAEHMDYAIYHLDGVKQLPFLDDLLAEDSITGIQWVPGAGKDPKGSDKWMPVYKKIQAAGKKVVIDNLDGLPKYLSHVYKNLDNKLLMMSQVFLAKNAADRFLPEFMGGRSGVRKSKKH